MTPNVEPQARSLFNLPPNCQANQSQPQQQVAVSSNAASQEAVSACPEQPTASSQQANITPSQQQHHQHHNHQHQQLPPANAATSAAILSNSNYQLLNGRAQLMAGAGYTKSKSRLACADISIKWYIVVIALLGLICALIGTIVGAVHSVGRDYISLSLLLLGVGLVLIAISWIALRIAINTYKSNSASPLGTIQTNANLHSRSTLSTNSLGQGLNTSGGLLTNSPTQQRRPIRLHGHRNHHQFLISQQQQALVNERLYLMAAAAAAAAASSNMQRSMGSTSRPGSSQANETSHGPSSILHSIKQRIPRCLTKLISYSGARNNESNSIRAQASSEHSPPATISQANDHNQMQTSASTLATLLQQYRMLPSNHQASLLFTSNEFAPPPHPPPIHLLAAAAASVGPMGFGPHLHDSIFRPPPPSYNAAMQDQRIRMIMQERATLQQLQQNPTSAPVRQTACIRPPPPPPPPSISDQNFERISHIDHEQRQSALIDSNQSSSLSVGSGSSIEQDGTSLKPDDGHIRPRYDCKYRLVPLLPREVLANATGSGLKSEVRQNSTASKEKSERAHLSTVININENGTTISEIHETHR